jgi:hypothetical protein
MADTGDYSDWEEIVSALGPIAFPEAREVLLKIRASLDSACAKSQKERR